MKFENNNKGSSIANLAIRTIADEQGNELQNKYYLDKHKKYESYIDFYNNYGKKTYYDESPDLPDYFDYDNAGIHNSVFMGRDITARFNSGDMYAKIKDGSFDDLFVGDYFTKTINNKSMTCRIAGFDIYGGKFDNYPHHVVIVPDQYFFEAKMNSTNTVAGGYKGSLMRSTYIPQINGYLQTAFGSDHLLTIKEYLTDAVDGNRPSAGYRGLSTASSSNVQTDSIAELMTEIEVYGTRVWSSSGYDVGLGKTQLPLFNLAPFYINPGRFSWWLRDIVTNIMPCSIMSYCGNILREISYDYERYVRPRWCLKG